MKPNEGISLNDADGLATVLMTPIASMPAQLIDETGHQLDDDLSPNAGIVNGEGQLEYLINHPRDAFPHSILTALWRQRYAWVKSRTAMTLAAQARCRAFANGDKGEASKIWKACCKGVEIDAHLAVTLRPYQNAIAMFDAEIKPVEKQLAKLVKTLPCYPWMKSHKGIGDLYIAGIYGECGGPITKSHSVSALWKFFGLAVYEGKRQAFQTDAAENKRQSYSSRRRSLIAQIETAFVMTSSPGWREIYEERKLYELAKGCAKGHAHNRAKRYMGKRFLRELYRHAREVEAGHLLHETHTPNASLDNNSELNGHIAHDIHRAHAVQEATVNHFVNDPHPCHVHRGELKAVA
jgi:hypothetical protein